MNLAMEGLILAFLLQLLLTCTLEALSGLSGGRIRKVEAKNPVLAEKLENWLEHEGTYRAILKLLLFFLAALIGALTFDWLDAAAPALSRRWVLLLIAGAVMLVTCGSEILARFVLYRLDIAILRFTVPPLTLLAKSVFLPFALALEKVSATTDDWHRNDHEDEKVSVEDEILSFVESYNDESGGDLEEEEKQMIRGILEIGDMSVREIMTPRVDLVALPESATIAEAKQRFIESGHSRIPVYGRSVDEIRGIVYAKDFLTAAGASGQTLTALSHRPIFIPETKNVAELLEEIKRSRNHFAVIIDEYGGTSGVVTFEDIIEEIVGEVHDEYDTDDDFHSRPQLQPDGSIILEARTPVSDINELADLTLPDDDETDTIGGFLSSEFGHIPEVGETYTLPGQFRATVLAADKRRVIQVRIEVLDHDDAE